MAAKNIELPIMIDEAAFKAELEALKAKDAPGVEELVSLGETQIKFPLFPKRMPATAALSLALAQVPQWNVTYLIKNGAIVITTKNRASAKGLLAEKVIRHFHERPLAEAVYLLSDQTGASIVLDPRAGDKLLTPVSATFNNDVTLEGALTMLTDMAELKMVVVDQAIYVTTPEHAKTLGKAKN